jgi:hypothetical protein
MGGSGEGGGGCPVAECLVGSDMIIGLLEGGESGLEGRERQIAGVALREFAAVGAIGAFHDALELGGTGRKDNEANLALLTGGFELGHEL